MAWSLTGYAGKEGSTVRVDPANSTFQVSLDANPTTGFSWSVTQYDKKLLTLTGQQYQQPKTQLIGAGGQTVFTFSLNKGKKYPKSTQMDFTYARPWAHDSAMQRKVTIDFKKQ